VLEFAKLVLSIFVAVTISPLSLLVCYLTSVISNSQAFTASEQGKQVVCTPLLPPLRKLKEGSLKSDLCRVHCEQKNAFKSKLKAQ